MMTVAQPVFVLFVMSVAGPGGPPRASVAADPNDPAKTRPIVSAEEREKLGLAEKTWQGVVDPRAYAALDDLDHTVKSLKARLKKDRDVEAFDVLHRIRFEDMVYVQIRVKTLESQRCVLRSLNASEIHAPFLFGTVPGLCGYVTKAGLEKLAEHADVVSVCLDDKPLPVDDRIISKEDLPPPNSDATPSSQPGVAEGKVDVDVYRALGLTERLSVIVHLRRGTLPNSTSQPSDLIARGELRKRAEREVQDRVLSAINADDFRLIARIGSGITGTINREGVDKLWRNPDVVRVYLPERFRSPAMLDKKPS